MLNDTSILIDYFRKTDKENSTLVSLVKQGFDYSISAVTQYEIYRGALLGQISFWDNLLLRVTVLPFDRAAATVAVEINAELKRARMQIEIPDLFIASTAITNSMSLSTLTESILTGLAAYNWFNQGG